MEKKLHVIQADRYVVVADLRDASFKLFQIAFSRDASIFVTFPYLKGCGATMGIVTMPGGEAVFEHFEVGETFAVSSHLVKYAHHPSGRAHFSLTGKARTTGVRQSVPLSRASGHLFTVRFQGLRAFDKVEVNEKSTSKRKVVPFQGQESGEIKIVGQIYGERELLRLLHGAAGNKSYWIPIGFPDGSRRIGVVLATPYIFEGDRRYLLVTGQPNPDKFLVGIDEGLSFMGGFDSADHVDDYSRDSSYLMMFAHRMNMDELGKIRPNIDIETA